MYARTRKKDTRREWSKIEHNQELKTYMIEGLEKHWNPDEISGRMKKEKKPWYASKTAIYEWLRSVEGQRYCVHLYSKRYHKKKRLKKTERVMIPNRVSKNKSGYTKLFPSLLTMAQRTNSIIHLVSRHSFVNRIHHGKRAVWKMETR